MFVDEPFPSDEPADRSLRRSSPGDSFFPSAEPSPSATTALPPRVTVLLIGVDSGVGRNTTLTDTMMVASLDPVAKTVSMVSIPRDMVDAPLPKGRQVQREDQRARRLRPLDTRTTTPATTATARPSSPTRSAGCSASTSTTTPRSTSRASSRRSTPSTGSTSTSTTRCATRPTTSTASNGGYSIGAGRHHMNGNQALAYARIRKSVGESDFTRAARQQQVVVALKDKIVRGGFLDDPLGLLKAVGNTVKTNIPPSVVRQLAPLASEIGSEGHLPGGRRPSTRPVGVRLPWLDPAAGLRQDQGARREDVHAGRDPAGRPVRLEGADERGQGSGPAGAELRRRPEAQAQAEAHTQATPKPTPKPTPTPTPTATEPTPTPTPTSTGPERGSSVPGRAATGRRATADRPAGPPLVPCATVLEAGPVRPAYRSREAGREARSSVSASLRRDPIALPLPVHATARRAG